MYQRRKNKEIASLSLILYDCHLSSHVLHIQHSERGFGNCHDMHGMMDIQIDIPFPLLKN